MRVRCFYGRLLVLEGPLGRLGDTGILASSMLGEAIILMLGEAILRLLRLSNEHVGSKREIRGKWESQGIYTGQLLPTV